MKVESTMQIKAREFRSFISICDYLAEMYGVLVVICLLTTTGLREFGDCLLG